MPHSETTSSFLSQPGNHYIDGFSPWPQHLAADYRAKGYWQGQTIADFLQQCAESFADYPAMICAERIFSYAQLNHQVNRFAAAIQQAGYQANDRLVIQLPNIGEFFIAYFASIRIGMLPVMALPAHRHAEVASFIEQTQAGLYICADKHLGFDYRTLARQCQAKCPSLKQVIVVGEAQEFSTWQAVLDDANTCNLQVPLLSADQVAFFQLSGGSTGTPKLIPRTHDDYLYSVRASAGICQLTSASRKLMVLPVAHNFSLSSPGSLGVLSAGGTVVLARDATPATAFRLIQQHAVTHAALVPALAASWVEAIDKGQPNVLAMLTTLQVGGARLPDVLARKMVEQYGCKLQQVFGMAEGLVNFTHANDPVEVIIGTQGRAISPDDEIRVVDEYDQPVARGEVGHLLTRGPYTIRGYYKSAAYNERAFTVDGFYRTGDLVRITAEGCMIVEGRSKDQINRGGEKIATEEVEQALVEHPQVLQAALVAMPDAALGEKSCAYVQWRNEATDASATRIAMLLRQFLQQSGLATFKIPDRIELVQDFPYTALGKIDKKNLRQRLIDQPGIA